MAQKIPNPPPGFDELTFDEKLDYVQSRWDRFAANPEERDFMLEALKEAKAAYDSGEYPIGAVIVYQGEILARGRNAEDAEFDPTAHAEIVAIRKACRELRAPRLRGCTLYTTIYPCPMCGSSIVAAKMERVIYGGRTFPFFREVKWGRPRLEIVGPILDEECRSLFEQKLREKGRDDILNHGAQNDGAAAKDARSSSSR